MLRRITQLAAIAGVLTAMVAHAGKVIDAVLVTVNGAPILQSDLDEAIRFEAMLEQRAPDAQVNEQLVLDRLVDQELLRQQMQGGLAVSTAEISSRIAELRKQFSADDDAGWNALLAKYGLSDNAVRERVKDQLQVMHFVDLRLRPTVRVDADAVAAYYRDTLIPRLQQMNAPVEPLESVAGTIRELLVQQKIDSQLTAWLANLRSQSSIHVTHRSEPAVSLQMSPRLIPAQQPESGAK